jgi:hypothetical protein
MVVQVAQRGCPTGSPASVIVKQYSFQTGSYTGMEITPCKKERNFLMIGRRPDFFVGKLTWGKDGGGHRQNSDCFYIYLPSPE